MRRHHMAHALFAAVVATLATAIAAFAYGLVDMRSASPWIIMYAPIWQSILIAIPAGVALGAVRHKLSGPAFAAVATIVAALLGALLGEVTIGHSPHFSHERAVVFLTASWALAALASSLKVGFPNSSARGNQLNR